MRCWRATEAESFAFFFFKKKASGIKVAHVSNFVEIQKTKAFFSPEGEMTENDGKVQRMPNHIDYLQKDETLFLQLFIIQFLDKIYLFPPINFQLDVAESFKSIMVIALLKRVRFVLHNRLPANDLEYFVFKFNVSSSYGLLLMNSLSGNLL